MDEKFYCQVCGFRVQVTRTGTARPDQLILPKPIQFFGYILGFPLDFFRFNWS
jgi:hypothetical protein